MTTEMPRATSAARVPLGDDMRAAMIVATIENARQAPFFKARLGNSAANDLAANFAQIPPVTKKQIWAAGNAARVGSAEWRQYYTGGTTGISFPYQVSCLEQEQFGAIFAATFAGMPSVRAARLWDGAQIHGRNIPTPIRFHDFSVYSPGAFGHLSATLAADFDEPGLPSRCGMLTGGERVLKAFALWSTMQWSAPRWSLTAVVVFGAYLTAATRRLLGTAFGGTLIDRYGVSEAIGGATECACGWYHPDPCLLIEAVAPRGLGQVTEGIGRLLLTPLYPFQQRQPLLRYDAGDLAKVTHTLSCRPGELALQPLGRLENSIGDARDIFLAEGEILSVLEDVPEIARRPTLRDCADCDASWPVGSPLFRITPDADVIEVYLSRRATSRSLARDIESRLAQQVKCRTGIEKAPRIVLSHPAPKRHHLSDA